MGTRPFQSHQAVGKYESAPPRLLSRFGMVFAALIVMMLSAGMWLWIQVGTTVFFETIRMGFSMCFG